MTLEFIYSAMNAGKSTMLLQVAHNYSERNMYPFLLLPEVCQRSEITSRIGIKKEAHIFNSNDNILSIVTNAQKNGIINCVLIDEAQFMTAKQVEQVASIVDELNINVMCYGLRVDFKGNLFAGSASLLATADEIREVRTICYCGKKAIWTLRKDGEGRVVHDGEQILVGGNDIYESVCRKHWHESYLQQD